jgi:glucose/arabinose dehydrogenase
MINQIKSFKKRTIVILIIATLAFVIPIMYLTHNSSTAIVAPSITKDPNLKAEVVFQGLHNPTSMAFLGRNDILVLEKDQGTVQRITNGNMLAQPILSANVATEG